MAQPDLSLALVTPADVVRAYRAAEEEDPGYLAELCDGVTQEIEAWAERQLITRTHTDEPHDGTGTPYLALRNPPVTAITSIKYDGTSQPASYFGVAALADLLKDTDVGLLVLDGGWDARPYWHRRIARGIGTEPIAEETIREFLGSTDTTGIWKITYTGGFAATAPQLRIARNIAREMVIGQIRTNSMIGTASTSTEGYSEHRSGQGDLGVMARWRRHIRGHYYLPRVL